MLHPFKGHSFPFDRVYFGYATVSKFEKVFFIGGNSNQAWSVHLFENESWRTFGRLNHGRRNHVAMSFGTDVMIIGGHIDGNSSQPEIFSLIGDRKLVQIDQHLPESMFVNGIVIPINDHSSCQNREIGKMISKHSKD